jgi:hypothetical protein
MMVCWVIFAHRPSSSVELFQHAWGLCGPALIASMLVLPIVVVDVVRLSNKFAGPVHRMRRTIKQLADGRVVEPVCLRKEDFWYDFAEDFNRALARMQDPSSSQVVDAASDSVDCAESSETPVAV